jgi:hypothetical protein
MQNRIDLAFADGIYTFALPLPQIQELQRKTEIGIGGLFARVLKGCQLVGDQVVLNPAQAEYHVLDLVETIRQGLIGGNHGTVDGEEVKITPTVVNNLMATYVLERRLQDNWSMAASVLAACVVGFEAPADKKKD